MKKIALALLFSWYSFVNAQCYDVFGKNADCPTAEDSLVLYNNAIRVYEFYEKNSTYKRTGTQEIRNESEKRSVYADLQTAKRLFFVIRREVSKLTAEEKRFAAGKTSSKYKDIKYAEYYAEIDDYRFYQRDLENQIVNINAPMSLYDTRISPIVFNRYICIDTTDAHNGDLVHIPLYIPVVVKPYLLLTDSESIVRNKILRIIPKSVVAEKDPPKKFAVKRDSIIKGYQTIPENKPYELNDPLPYKYNGNPVHVYTHLGTGAIIGFFYRRYFFPIKPSDYRRFAVPKWAQEILINTEELKKMLKQKYGEYFIDIAK